MNGKTAESRHAEHELMYEEFRKSQERWEDFTGSVTRAIAEHGDALHANALETAKQLSDIKVGIGEKTSIDSALMGRQGNLEGMFRKLDEQHDIVVRTAERLTVIVEQHGKQIDDAHAAVRKVDAKIEVLEKKSGRLALRAWGVILTAVVSIGTALGIAWAAGILHLKG